MINWYRAALRERSRDRGQVTAKGLLLWGEGDRFLRASLIALTQEMCSDLTVVRFPQNTHWLPHEAPAEVVHQLEAFFGAHPEHGGMMTTLPSDSE